MPPAKPPIPGSKFEIAAPKSYRVFSAPPPEVAPPKPEAVRLKVAVPAAEEPAVEKRAIWIVHGMGQQIPFETLDSLTEGIKLVGRPPAGTTEIIPRYRAVKIGEQVLQRVEVNVRNARGVERELHLYEAYWAPKTEGAIKLREVIGFLFEGGLRGIINSMKAFQRAMFHGMSKFRIPFHSPFMIALTLLVLLALVGVNAVIVAVGAAQYNLPGLRELHINGHWDALTASASTLTAIALTFAAILLLAVAAKPGGLPRPAKFLISVVTWLGCACTILGILYGAIVLWLIALGKCQNSRILGLPFPELQGISTFLILCSLVLIGLNLFSRALFRAPEEAGFRDGLSLFLFLSSFVFHLAALLAPFTIDFWIRHFAGIVSCLAWWFGKTFWVWPILIALSYMVRTLIVQYVGDIAIYITHNQIDRFDAIRKAIKDLAYSSASAVYLARNDTDTGFEYEKVAVVGHSLGSLIAYDALNRLVNEDSLTGGHIGVAGRTGGFVTFGSPLDKIAFFFSIQGKTTSHIREQIAAVVQPLIQDYAFRPFPWINVRSRHDIISGKLTFFDPPNPHVPPGVNEVIDKDAVVPLVAHVQYWQNRTVWENLYNAIT